MVAAVLTFLAVESAMLGVTAWLNTPRTTPGSAAPWPIPCFYITEAGVLTIGALTGLLGANAPWFVLLLIPAYGFLQQSRAAPPAAGAGHPGPQDRPAAVQRLAAAGHRGDPPDERGRPVLGRAVRRHRQLPVLQPAARPSGRRPRARTGRPDHHRQRPPEGHHRQVRRRGVLRAAAGHRQPAPRHRSPNGSGSRSATRPGRCPRR